MLCCWPIKGTLFCQMIRPTHLLHVLGRTLFCQMIRSTHLLHVLRRTLFCQMIRPTHLLHVLRRTLFCQMIRPYSSDSHTWSHLFQVLGGTISCKGNVLFMSCFMFFILVLVWIGSVFCVMFVFVAIYWWYAFISWTLTPDIWKF